MVVQSLLLENGPFCSEPPCSPTSLGLRYGRGPDHIAAIDNVTRKLMQEGKRLVASGFFISLGHSVVVVPA